MNVYEKLNKVRQEFAQSKIRKSGKNAYVGYDYFELADFLQPIQALCDKYGLATVISFTTEVATMKIVDVEKPADFIEFTSPMSEANLKNCHPVQNVGAVETYQRRYLYLVAFEIVENDTLEPVTGIPEKNGFEDAELRKKAEALVLKTDWDEEKKAKHLAFIPKAPAQNVRNLVNRLQSEGYKV